MSPTLNGIPKISKVYMSSKKCKPGRSKYRNCFQPGRHARLKIQKYAEYPKQIISGIMIIRYNLAALIRVSAQRTFRHNFRQPLAASLFFSIQIDMIISHDISKNQTPFSSIRYHFAIFTGNFGISGQQSRDCTSHDHPIPKPTSPFDSPWSVYPI